MRIFRISTGSLSKLPLLSSLGQAQRSPGRAVTIGNFDGVHVGHQALLQQLREIANDHQLTSCALSFEPHPREFFAEQNGSKAPARISNLRNKLIRLANCGIDETGILRFGHGIAQMSPDQFVEKVLVQLLNTKYLLVGDDFRFGKGRAGTYQGLVELAPTYAMTVQRINTIEVAVQAQPQSNGQISSQEPTLSPRASSSRVRHALAMGDFAQAKRLLNSPYLIAGRVQHGKKIGRTLGFPTLNISMGSQTPVLHGIYTVSVHGLTDKPLAAVASLGTRPAVEANGRFKLEVYVLDWSGDAYGKRLSVEFHAWLRDEANYAGLELLKQQIAQDVIDAREWFNEHHINPTVLQHFK